ncbi:hypothetical protein Zmor_025657 [Zophobas morio]|uniref:Replication protein A subunit n=1 Tax=Zophobas morio TaxID=2755281 RepID=A0AA38M4S9_9CUCU|nr:hypothetical protein Zmor_025657 [Zophobas morio]
MPPQLSTGALLRIMKDEKVPEPIVQILQSKKINCNSDKERYRLLISDGKYQISHAMLTGVSGVENFSIIKMKQYHLSELSSSQKINKILLIIGMEVLCSMDEKIGNPEQLTDQVIASHSSSEAKPVTNTVQSVPEQPRDLNQSLNQSLSESRVISQISALTPYHNKWVIKARVSNKSQMRTWSNSRGEGKLFSVDLMDESGEIRCTAFRDLADKYFNYLQVDKVYYFSKCQLKPANKQFNTLKNDYEMTIGNETVIEECLNDDGLVPQVKYSFVPISSVAELAVGALIDVIGVCKEVSDIQNFTSRTTNREMTKRDVILVDQSKTSITLTLWGSQAESFDGVNNPVVLVRGAKVGEFGGGKTLSTVMSSQMKINPDIQECHKIKGWFDLEGKESDVKNLSERTGSGSFQSQWLYLKEVQDKGLGNSERGDYFQTLATVLLMRSENAIYKACPTPDCNKKVVDLENGMYRCEKCNREYPNFKYRLLVSMNIGDFSGNQWVSVFSGEAEKILGKTSQEVGLAMEDNSEAGTAIFQNANFKQFIFKCRAKVETYNDEQRLKIVVVNVENVDYEKHSGQLCKEIAELTGISA